MYQSIYASRVDSQKILLSQITQNSNVDELRNILFNDAFEGAQEMSDVDHLKFDLAIRELKNNAGIAKYDDAKMLREFRHEFDILKKLPMEELAKKSQIYRQEIISNQRHNFLQQGLGLITSSAGNVMQSLTSLFRGNIPQGQYLVSAALGSFLLRNSLSSSSIMPSHGAIERRDIGFILPTDSEEDKVDIYKRLEIENSRNRNSWFNQQVALAKQDYAKIHPNSFPKFSEIMERIKNKKIESMNIAPEDAKNIGPKNLYDIKTSIFGIEVDRYDGGNLKKQNFVHLSKYSCKNLDLSGMEIDIDELHKYMITHNVIFSNVNFSGSKIYSSSGKLSLKIESGNLEGATIRNIDNLVIGNVDDYNIFKKLNEVSGLDEYSFYYGETGDKSIDYGVYRQLKSKYTGQPDLNLTNLTIEGKVSRPHFFAGNYSEVDFTNMISPDPEQNPFGELAYGNAIVKIGSITYKPLNASVDDLPVFGGGFFDSKELEKFALNQPIYLKLKIDETVDINSPEFSEIFSYTKSAIKENFEKYNIKLIDGDEKLPTDADVREIIIKSNSEELKSDQIFPDGGVVSIENKKHVTVDILKLLRFKEYIAPSIISALGTESRPAYFPKPPIEQIVKIAQSADVAPETFTSGIDDRNNIEKFMSLVGREKSSALVSEISDQNALSIIDFKAVDENIDYTKFIDEGVGPRKMLVLNKEDLENKQSVAILKLSDLYRVCPPQDPHKTGISELIRGVESQYYPTAMIEPFCENDPKLEGYSAVVIYDESDSKSGAIKKVLVFKDDENFIKFVDGDKQSITKISSQDLELGNRKIIYSPDDLKADDVALKASVSAVLGTLALALCGYGAKKLTSRMGELPTVYPSQPQANNRDIERVA